MLAGGGGQVRRVERECILQCLGPAGWSKLLFSCYASLAPPPLPPRPLALPGPINTFREMSPPLTIHPRAPQGGPSGIDKQQSDPVLCTEGNERRAVCSQDGQCLPTHPGEPPPPQPSPFLPQLLNMFISILMKSLGQWTLPGHIIPLHKTLPNFGYISNFA